MKRFESNQKMVAASYQPKLHYKMFKAGKIWTTVGISVLFVGGFALSQPTHSVHADTTSTEINNTKLATIQDQSATSATDQTFNVTLAAGMTAPTWTASDFVTTLTDAQANTYAVSLSAQGLAALQAVNPHEKLTSANIQSGVLTVDQTTATPDTEAQTSSQTSSTTQAVQQAAASHNVDTSNSEQSQSVADENEQTQPATGNAAQAQTSASDTTQAKTITGNATQPTSTTTRTDLGDATSQQVTTAKQKASADYAATKTPQQVTAASAPADQATASIKSSVDRVGYGSGITGFKLTVSMNNVKAGDVITYTIPTTQTDNLHNGIFTLDNVQGFASEAVGTVKQTILANGNVLVTNTINQAGTFAQEVSFTQRDNYSGQSLLPVGDVVNTVDIYVNGTKQVGGSATFTQTVTPTADIQTPTRLYPDTTIKGILPNIDYVWELPINEDTGILNDYYRASRVNSAVNYGTVITVPVPTGFVLNADLTSQVNGFGDATTITQPDGAGGDVLITVPKGSGSQYYYFDAAYRIAGHFDVAQSDTDTTLTANGAITMVQKINDAGDTIEFDGGTWQDILLATDSTQGALVSATANGNDGANPTQLVLGGDTPNSLLQYQVAYQSASATDHATITMTVPDGMAVTKIVTPVGGVTSSVYMPGTTQYSYVLTLTDGQTVSGTVSAGGTVTSDTPITQAVFTPNYLAPGAKSGVFKLQGELSSKVSVGETFTGTVKFAVDTAQAEKSVTETLTGPIAWVDIDTNNSHTQTAPGEGQGSMLVVWGAQTSAGQNVYKIYEPIFYYDLPKAFAIDGVKNNGNATVTFGESASGDTVVKVDYTGTGEYVDLTEFGYENKLQLLFHNASDATNGSYTWYVYVTSPVTGTVQQTAVDDVSRTMGDAKAVLVNSGELQIDTLSGVYAIDLAQGDDISATQAATIDKNSAAPLNFYNNVMNLSGNDLKDVTSVINLPQAGDDQGSTYTYQLTGPVTLPTTVQASDGQSVALTGAKVLYSTARAALTAQTPDLTNFVIADQITDWSTVQAVAIVMPTLPASTTTGRITLAGSVDDMANLAGASGVIGTAFYTGGQLVTITNHAASITITGQSTIYARLHYVDVNGVDQYVALPALNKTLTDNVDTFTDDYPETIDEALIPDGYVLRANSLHLVDSRNDGVATFGETVRNHFDGDFAQYELDAKASLTVSYVDQTTGDTVGQPQTVSGICRKHWNRHGYCTNWVPPSAWTTSRD